MPGSVYMSGRNAKPNTAWRSAGSLDEQWRKCSSRCARLNLSGGMSIMIVSFQFGSLQW